MSVLDLPVEAREWSDGNYFGMCLLAAREPEYLRRFRRSPSYQRVVETVNSELAESCLNVALQRTPEIADSLNTFRENDDIGGAPLFLCKPYGYFGGTTARYVNNISELKQIFGSLANLSIAEIGCGYGGLGNLIIKYFKPRSYTFIDHPDVVPLIRRYLSFFRQECTIEVCSANEVDETRGFDMVISNYAFTELPRDIQSDYFERVIRRAKHGYITANVSPEWGNYSVQEIVSRLPGAQVKREEPSSGPLNCVIVW